VRLSTASSPTTPFCNGYSALPQLKLISLPTRLHHLSEFFYSTSFYSFLLTHVVSAMGLLSVSAITSRFVGATDCAWTLYKDCKNSSEDFQRISQEVASLHVVLKEAADLLEFGNPVDLGSKSERLTVLIQGCNDTLAEVRNLLDKYESLGTQAQRK